MKEQNFGNSKQQGSVDLEKRLSAYYGPSLREQPLSEASWQKLSLQLASQEGAGRRCQVRWPFPRKTSRADIPRSLQSAYFPGSSLLIYAIMSRPLSTIAQQYTTYEILHYAYVIFPRYMLQYIYI